MNNLTFLLAIIAIHAITVSTVSASTVSAYNHTGYVDFFQQKVIATGCTRIEAPSSVLHRLNNWTSSVFKGDLINIETLKYPSEIVWAGGISPSIWNELAAAKGDNPRTLYTINYIDVRRIWYKDDVVYPTSSLETPISYTDSCQTSGGTISHISSYSILIPCFVLSFFHILLFLIN